MALSLAAEQRRGSGLALALAVIVAAGSCRQKQASYDETVAFFHAGKFSEAIQRIEKRLADKRIQRLEAARFRLLAAEVLLNRDKEGDAVRARALLAIPLPDGLNAGPLGVTGRRLRAYDNLKFLGNVKLAQELLEEARQLASSLSLTGELAAVQILRGRALFTSQPRLAESATRSALALAEATGDRFQKAAALNTLAMFRIQNYRFDEAIPLLLESKDSAVRGGAISFVQNDLINLGICNTFLGDFDEAESRFKQAQAVMVENETLGKWASLWGGWGNVYMLGNEPEQAIPLFEKARAMAGNQSDKAAWTRNLAESFIQDQKWEAASEAQAAVPPITPEAEAGAKLVAARIADGQGNLEDARALFRQCLRAKEIGHEELWEAHAGLAKIYMKTGAPGDANRHFEAALAEINLTIAQLPPVDTDIHRITYLSRLIHFYQDYVQALVDQNQADKALRVVESSRARILANRLAQNRKWDGRARSRAYQEIAERSQAVILSYWLAPAGSFAWVISGRKTQLIRLPAAGEIDRLAREYNDAIENSPRDPMLTENSSGGRLYEILLAPVAPAIPHGSRVIIVPDGSLHALNFETLPVYDQGPWHYWLEDAIVSTTPGLDLLATDYPPAGHTPRTALIIGDPDRADSRFPKLDQAALEIANIAGHFSSRNQVITGPRATPRAYLNSAPGQFAVIHFSAHAVANQPHPLESFIALSGGEDNFKLYARDVLGVPLDADLVTISACRAAGRSYSGEGLVGFVWAFMQAGARNVIASLWDVADSSTPEMMDILYGRIQAGRSPAEALHSAKLALAHRQDALRKPRYWGPFQLYVR